MPISVHLHLLSFHDGTKLSKILLTLKLEIANNGYAMHSIKIFFFSQIQMQFTFQPELGNISDQGHIYVPMLIKSK